MTREEAAKICQSIKFILENSDYTEAVEEALDMAIAALKQLSLPKIIIRQGEQEPSAQPFTAEQIQTMQELEAAQVEKAYELGKADRPKWIPLNAKGREPENNGEYLLQLSDGFITATYYDGKDWELWADAGEPVAWMPLPEAYREDEQ